MEEHFEMTLHKMRRIWRMMGVYYNEMRYVLNVMMARSVSKWKRKQTVINDTNSR
jgi:hypothetical protein